MKLSKSMGFTLIELLVVISILGILATGLLTIINPVAQLQKSQDTKMKSDLNQIQKALETYYTDNGCYPPSSAGYQIINGISATPCLATGGTTIAWGANWPSIQAGGTPYMSTLPADGVSGHKYVYYTATGQSYYLYANLNRGANDPQICKNLNANSECPNVPAANLCGGAKCNFGLSSPDKTP